MRTNTADRWCGQMMRSNDADKWYGQMIRTDDADKWCGQMISTLPTGVECKWRKCNKILTTGGESRADTYSAINDTRHIPNFYHSTFFFLSSVMTILSISQLNSKQFTLHIRGGQIQLCFRHRYPDAHNESEYVEKRLKRKVWYFWSDSDFAFPLLSFAMEGLKLKTEK